MTRPGCPKVPKEAWEWRAPNETTWRYQSLERTCQQVNKSLIPSLRAMAPRSNQSVVDMGHFHIRGPVIACLADLLQDQAVFVRIRRNRYDIASSFAAFFKTPCLTSSPHRLHPTVTVCPHSHEVAEAGPVHLNVSDEIWDKFTPFQRFLWYADEVEERWHELEKRVYTKRPQFYQITWTSSEELRNGLDAVRQNLGCKDDERQHAVISNRNQHHRRHAVNRRNCSDMTRQDLEYRRLMKYEWSSQQYRRLFFRQRAYLSDCNDTYDQLVTAIRQYSGQEQQGDNEAIDLVADGAWILPDVSNRSTKYDY